MKANSPNTNSQFIVFGLDDTGKPKAGRFTHKEAEAAKDAAASMKLTVHEFAASEAEERSLRAFARPKETQSEPHPASP